jgi:SNF2 family DNA or RNA helicase
MNYSPYPYQAHSEDHIIDNPGAGLFLEMGLGKTVITLTAIDRLLFDQCEVSRVLVIAPKRVAEDTWTTEAAKWDHLRHLRIAKVLGTERERLTALRSKADIYVINRENVVWLIAQYGTGFPFDMVVIDELSSFKSQKSARFKALRKVRPFARRVVGLTGTPAPNGLLDLWAQLYLLDRGERLGDTYTGFRVKFFIPDKRDREHIHSYKIREDEGYNARDRIYEKIGDICISMKSEDYLSLPARIDRVVRVNFPPEVREQYDAFEASQVLALSELETISAVNAAALTTKLLQFANGALYDEDRKVHTVHDEKLDALEEILEAAVGQPVLIFYSYQHDLVRIQARVKGIRVLRTSADIAAWNKGDVPIMAAHPASAGHGLNLQAGGNIIVWFGLTWSLELYQQANARLHRQGQTRPVIIHHLVAIGTVDEDVMAALETKAVGQEALMQAVKARVQKYLHQAIS